MAYSDMQAVEIVISVTPDIILLGTRTMGKDSVGVLKHMREFDIK